MNKREWMLQTVTAWYGRGYEIKTSVTPEMLLGELAALYDAIVAASPDTTWIEHRGEKPYPEGMVDVKFRSGAIVKNEDADEWMWSHDGLGDAGEIVAWRPA